MKHSIDLLVGRRNYQHKERLFRNFRVATVFIGAACASALIVVFYLKTKAHIEKQQLLSEKEKYLSELLTNKNIEKKVLYFNEKSIAFEKELAKDVNFLPYFKRLQAYLQTSTGSGAISDMSYSSEREASFTLNFLSYPDLLNALSSFEDERFLRVFENLTLKSLSSPDKKTNDAYKLTFKGTFAPIENEKIY